VADQLTACDGGMTGCAPATTQCRFRAGPRWLANESLRETMSGTASAGADAGSARGMKVHGFPVKRLPPSGSAKMTTTGEIPQECAATPPRFHPAELRV
jgi:hypothetical protein